MGPMGKAGGGGAQKIEMERLRREDHLRVKHDKLFSDWKILVGPEDWKDHIAGEDGSQRYRLHNLPASYFGPGVYELGLTQRTTTQDSKQRKLRRHAVVVVYLGQADNVRQRLQRYGQTGSHLEGTRPGLASAIDVNPLQKPRPQPEDRQPYLTRWFTGPTETTTTTPTVQVGLHLFTEVFSRGYSVAFRWARTESKQMAERVESELLHVFDYPWNTSLNGARRPRDILAKLDLLQYQIESSLCLGRAVGIGWRKWEYLGRKVGIAVPVRKPNETRQPRAKIPISFFSSSTNGGGTPPGSAPCSVCGIPLEDGSVCARAPVKGRRRCAEHKGQRTKVSTRRPRTRTVAGPATGNNIERHAGTGPVTGSNMARHSGSESVTGSDIYRHPNSGPVTGSNMARHSGSESVTGSDIYRQPSSGPVTGSDADWQPASPRDHLRGETPTAKPAVVIIRAQMQGKRVEITDVSSDGAVICGARVHGGSPCVSRPVHGRKRCAVHKGLRVSKSISNSIPKVSAFGNEEVWSGPPRWMRNEIVAV